MSNADKACIRKLSLTAQLGAARRPIRFPLCVSSHCSQGSPTDCEVSVVTNYNRYMQRC